MANYFRKYFRQDNLALLLCLTIILFLFLPSVIFGVKYTYDMPYHLSWYLSFRDSFGQGAYYPRWLDSQFLGLGSPALFFYPPFTNYFFLLVDTITGKKIPVDNLLAFSAFLMCIASFSTFYFWIINFTKRASAIGSSFLYAIAPYHLLVDFFVRGAFAEFAAFIWIPLVFLSIYKLHLKPEKISIVLFSLSTAALLFTHLLTAIVIAPAAMGFALLLILKSKLTADEIWKRIYFLLTGGLLALGLSAIYTVPALTMMGFINATSLQWPIENSYLYKVITNPSANYASLIKSSIITASYLLFITFIVVKLSISRKSKNIANTDNWIFWLIICIVSSLIMNGAFHFLFLPPSPYANLQFSWRFLVLMEFSFITMVAIFLENIRQHSQSHHITLICLTFFLLLICVSAMNIISISRGINHKVSALQWESVVARLSPPEYFPHEINLDENIASPIRILEKYAANDSIKGSAQLIKTENESYTYKISLDHPEKIILSKFYFPGWSAVDNFGIHYSLQASSNSKLLSLYLPAGNRELTIRRKMTMQEKIGTALTLLALIIILFLLLLNNFSQVRNSR